MYLRQACGSEAEGLGSELTVDLKNLFITGFNACIWSMRERENERKSEREEGRGRARHEDHIVEASGDDLQELDHAPRRPAHPARPHIPAPAQPSSPRTPAPAGLRTPASAVPHTLPDRAPRLPQDLTAQLPAHPSSSGPRAPAPAGPLARVLTLSVDLWRTHSFSNGPRSLPLSHI